VTPPDDPNTLGEMDLHLFAEGTHHRVFQVLGAHPAQVDGAPGHVFRVWAPNASAISVVGAFNDWDAAAAPMAQRGQGIWERFVAGVGPGERYKYRLTTAQGVVDKTDPVGFFTEPHPGHASLTCRLDHDWQDAEWMRARAARGAPDAAISIYELHLGSWRRRADGSLRSFDESADELAHHLTEHGFTHVELMPVSEHPFYGSWGYHTTGYFAVTSRYGTPRDLMRLVDTLHAAGVGVILDWVPGHFPTDAFALASFDGTHLYEHADARRGRHPEWGSAIFNFGRHEVRSFLLSSAVFWLETFHLDGLRVDAVASMLYLDYGRREGEWIPNEHGGRENLEAVEFLQRLNDVVHEEVPGVVTFAEESTSWPRVTGPTRAGGLGFDYKWDLGWMHDSLDYLKHEPVHRRYHHDKLTFRRVYAFSERFLLPLSHDEVVHGKGSLLTKMPGDNWQRFANLRLLYAKMFAEPGKKLLFMGSELAPWGEWSHDTELEWELADAGWHGGIRRLVGDLNRLYREVTALHRLDADPMGFEWIDHRDVDHSVTSHLRSDGDGDLVIAVFNHTPVPRHSYRVGAPRRGHWQEVLNTDATLYGGSGMGNLGGVDTSPVGGAGRPHSLLLTLPPLAALYFRLQRE